MKKQIILKTVYILLAFTVVINFAYAKSNKKLYDNENQIISHYENGGSPWIAPKSADKLKNPLKNTLSVVKKGKNLFNIYCVSCHGTEGEGNGMAAAGLNPKPANLTSEKVQKQSDGAIFWKITTGRPPMISWKSTFSEKQRWQLVSYIRQLKKIEGKEKK